MTCRRSIDIFCDRQIESLDMGRYRCMDHYPTFTMTYREAREEAGHDGWVVLDGRDYCPKHASLGES